MLAQLATPQPYTAYLHVWQPQKPILLGSTAIKLHLVASTLCSHPYISKHLQESPQSCITCMVRQPLEAYLAGVHCWARIRLQVVRTQPPCLCSATSTVERRWVASTAAS